MKRRTATVVAFALTSSIALALTGCGSDPASPSTANATTAVTDNAPGVSVTNGPDSAAVKSDLRTLANEMETYYTNYQAYPATISQQATVVDVGDVRVNVSQGNTFVGGANVPASDPAGYCITGTSGALVLHYDSVNGGIADGPCA